VRLGLAVKALLTVAVALRLHHHFAGPPVDYYGLAVAAAASWVGVPGPGEPVLIAAGVLAAQHKLDIRSVLLVAWAAATVGGVVGWYVAMKAGRAVLVTRGPLHQMRRKALARGDEIFGRYAVIAILLTPSWIAGIHRVRASVYLPTNAVGAAIWSVGIGLGAYLVGPTVVDVVDDLGWVTAVGLLALILAGAAIEITRRRRRARGRKAGPPTGNARL
jgi:membrane protein DedA with SNARE-associated domain